MNILIFSICLISIILLIKYFKSSEQDKGLKLITIFGIGIGILALGLNLLFSSCFGASTPVDIQTKNLTAQKLKIYAIAFWDNKWNGSGNYVNFDKELKPNEVSDFSFENDGTTEFWIVAKNENDEIKYLKVITSKEKSYNFDITTNQNIEIDKEQIANELTFKTDKSKTMEKYLIWSNIILIGVLGISLIKKPNTAN